MKQELTIKVIPSDDGTGWLVGAWLNGTNVAALPIITSYSFLIERIAEIVQSNRPVTEHKAGK